MAKKINSHVQLSKGIIKNFAKSEDDGNIFALNLNTWEIDDKKGPGKTGVIKGYFNRETEQFLCNNYETPVGNIIQKLKEFETQNKPAVLAKDEMCAISRFLAMLMTRDPSMIEQTMAKTIIAKFLEIKPTPSRFVRLPEDTDLIKTFFDDHYPVIVFNKSTKSFVSSIKGFCIWKSTGGSYNWWFPVTPTIAIHFVGKDVFDKLYHRSSSAELPEEESIQNYNDMMCRAALNGKSEFVFSNKDDELNRLVNEFKPK